MHRIALVALAFLTSCASAAAAPALQCLVTAAREQIGQTLSYDPSYQRLDYPGGDVAIESGVCTDVLVRAYRKLGIDLQVLVHEDMRANFSQYPKLWGLRSTDRNIDHRRVPNLGKFFARHGTVLGVDSEDAEFIAGDIVSWRLPSGVPHIGIVADRRNANGTPLVVHNIGVGAVEEDLLREFAITGHYRYRPAALPPECRAQSRND